MIRTNAERNVAAVQALKAVWDGTINQLPRDAMGVVRAAVDRDLAVAADRRRGPQPAVGSLVDFRPEALFNGDAQRAAVAVMRTVALRASRDESTATSLARLNRRICRFGQLITTYIIRLNTYCVHFVLHGVCEAVDFVHDGNFYRMPSRLSIGTPVLALMAFACCGRGAWSPRSSFE